MQAVILALWYWVTTWYIGYTWGSATFGDALVTGLVVGIVLGDVPTAMKCAAVIKPMFLAFTGAGGTVVWDEAAATLGGISVTLVSGLDVSQSVTIAVPLSLLCAQLHTIRRERSFTSLHVHSGDIDWRHKSIRVDNLWIKRDQSIDSSHPNSTIRGSQGRLIVKLVIR